LAAVKKRITEFTEKTRDRRGPIPLRITIFVLFPPVSIISGGARGSAIEFMTVSSFVCVGWMVFNRFLRSCGGLEAMEDEEV
jgi:hypothetical protein